MPCVTWLLTDLVVFASPYLARSQRIQVRSHPSWIHWIVCWLVWDLSASRSIDRVAIGLRRRWTLLALYQCSSRMILYLWNPSTPWALILLCTSKWYWLLKLCSVLELSLSSRGHLLGSPGPQQQAHLSLHHPWSLLCPASSALCSSCLLSWWMSTVWILPSTPPCPCNRQSFHDWRLWKHHRSVSCPYRRGLPIPMVSYRDAQRDDCVSRLSSRMEFQSF